MRKWWLQNKLNNSKWESDGFQTKYCKWESDGFQTKYCKWENGGFKTE